MATLSPQASAEVAAVSACPHMVQAAWLVERRGMPCQLAILLHPLCELHDPRLAGAMWDVALAANAALLEASKEVGSTCTSKQVGLHDVYLLHEDDLPGN